MGSLDVPVAVAPFRPRALPVACCAMRRSLAIVFVTLLGCSVGSASGRGGVSGRTVVVPHVGRSVLAAYARLHAAGLRVSIPRGLSFSSMSPPTVKRIAPLPGKRVLRGSVVTLAVSYGDGVSSPAVPVGRLTSYQVPDFVGSSASAAYAWVRRKTLYFTAKLGRLRAGNAPDLFANYRVTRQRPSPGAMLTLGRESRSNGGRQGSFLPTPLTVDGVQGSSRSSHPSCTPAPGAHVVASNRQAVITSRTSNPDVDGTISWYGCLLTVGHQWLLNSGPNFPDSPDLILKTVALAGHLAGLHFYYFNKDGSYYDQTTVYDVGGRRSDSQLSLSACVGGACITSHVSSRHGVSVLGRSPPRSALVY
jgi:hypothetical protein